MPKGLHLPPMLTEKEKAFLVYWAANRQKQKKLMYQLGVGLHFGLLLGAIILTNFFSGWYKRAEMIANIQFNPVVLYVAVLIIAVFIAIFSKKFQWDQQELRYRELLHKQKQSEESTPTISTNDEEHSS
ncbi:MAG TPA: hypothetical protein VLL95_04300 [Phnomibacter sp.]|nr:hypothetical protein [Phnomibacter sp.]